MIRAPTKLFESRGDQMNAMQMSLTNPLPQAPAAAGGLQRLTPLSREAVMSQLDRIAGVDAPPLAAHGLGGMAGVMALVGGLVVVGMALMWQAPEEPLRRPSAQAAPAAKVAVVAAPVARLPDTATASATPVVTAQPTAPAAPLPLVAAAQPEPRNVVAAAALTAAKASVANDDAARQARAKQQAAAARRKAALLAQEQAAHEQQAQRDAALAENKRERAEQAAEEERRRLAAAERKRAAAAVLVALDTSRRSVAETCAVSGGFFGQNSCRAQECGKAEHQRDAVCLRLREIEEVQRRASVDR